MKLAKNQAKSSQMFHATCIFIFPFAIFMSSVVLGQAARPDDVGSIDGLINAYYESVSGHPGKRDAERMRSLFIRDGKMGIRLTADEPVHQRVEEVLLSDRFLTISSDFYEREISRDTQQFRDMANVISTYGISDAMENNNYTARGVTVFQLIHHNDRWWILSTMFQRESQKLPLPDHLLD